MAGDVRFAVDGAQAARLRPHTGKRVLFGVRPEDLHLPLDGEAAGASGVRMRVALVENMGAEVLVYLASDGVEFIARTTGRRLPKAGDTLTVVFDAERLHVFDAATEEALA
jgi:multiple sugar transport system ATP-binding protein